MNTKDNMENNKNKGKEHRTQGKTERTPGKTQKQQRIKQRTQEKNKETITTREQNKHKRGLPRSTFGGVRANVGRANSVASRRTACVSCALYRTPSFCVPSGPPCDAPQWRHEKGSTPKRRLLVPRWSETFLCGQGGRKVR